MRITDVRCHVLLDPAYDIGATSSAQDDIVVEIETDMGITGVGETDVNPWIARACIEAPGTHTMGLGLRDMLLGEDPLQVERLWEQLYVGSAMNGRRGAVINAMGAIDIALHDLRGKALGKPCYQLLDGDGQALVTPYASLQPEVSGFEAYRDSLVRWAVDAKGRGFSAAKLEVTLSGPYAHKALNEPNWRMTEVIAAVRNAVGDEMVLMVDVQYAFPDADTCLQTIRDWRDFDLFFIETPIPSDDLDGYLKLAETQPIPIAAGEWLTTRHEFIDLMDRGGVQVVQPDIGRVGGLTEARRVCELAKQRGLTVVPHLWKTGISVAAAAHLAAAHRIIPYIEFLPSELSESALRSELLAVQHAMTSGTIALTDRPGLGIEIDREAMERFELSAGRLKLS
jgi:L-alanine-DL-glutamate epimerase-like enolase superfamily enzyme